MVKRLERIGGLRKEEFILLKALVLANSLTINASLHKDENRIKEGVEEETSLDEDQSESINKIEKLKESLLCSLYDCMAITRYVLIETASLIRALLCESIYGFVPKIIASSPKFA